MAQCALGTRLAGASGEQTDQAIDEQPGRAMTPAELTTVDTDAGLTITFAGDWLLKNRPPSVADALGKLAALSDDATVDFDTGGIGEWDTGLLTHLVAIRRAAETQGLELDTSGLPEGAQRLMTLAFAVKEPEGARRKARDKSIAEAVGDKFYEEIEDARRLFAFMGELVYSFGRMLRGKATYLRSDLVLHIQEAGVEAFPIVSVISFLIGMIFAFVGVMQLEDFGAGIYTADLVAIAMVREMSPIMTAIIMAGRTGAAYAASIGTMKVNEEVDALATLGMNPIDFLVTPRVIALVVMMPLLTLYSSLMGILGGTAVSLVMLDASLLQYTAQTVAAVDLSTMFGGLFKSIVYGSLVALAGCQQGMACGASAMAVGQSTTRAVVMGIVLIVVSASALTIIYINLGI
jgi:phospholipid/cholesterol/gamma-HCH transport system permease protein